MTTLRFHVSDPSPSSQVATSAVSFRLRIQNEGQARVHMLALRCQVQIEPRVSRRSVDEAKHLRAASSHSPLWSRKLRPLLWARVALIVPAFERVTTADLVVPCTYDFQIASTRYLHGVRDDGIPLRFLFTGSIFRLQNEAFSVEPVPWDTDATFTLPATVWRTALDRILPHNASLSLRRETLDALLAFRTSRALPTWDDTLDVLLDEVADRQHQ